MMNNIFGAVALRLTVKVTVVGSIPRRGLDYSNNKTKYSIE